MTVHFSMLRTSPERLETVIADINEGSQPRSSFFLLLGTAALIASMGLVANSTAVVIGAMLVSPLMTPIFGISLGMLRGDMKLFMRAALAEIAGVTLAMGVSYLFGLTPILVEAQSEMISRTQPTILDMLVAVFAGFAGAFALVDERISPALPGVAIATAIVPPLSTSGLYLALGDETQAFGAFMLFLANFVSILLVGLATFAAAGISATFSWTTPSDIVRRFGLASVSFLLIAAFLSQHVGRSIRIQRTARVINSVLGDEFSSHYSGVVEEVRRRDFELTRDAESGERVVGVLAAVSSPVALTPDDVTHLQTQLSSALNTRVRLVVRNSIQRDVAAVGSTLEASVRSAGRGLLTHATSKKQTMVRLAEQVIRERLSNEPGFELISVDYGESEKFPFIVTSIDTIRRLTTDDVRSLRHMLRKRLGTEGLQLLIRSYSANLMTSDERYLFEWTDLSGLLEVDEIVLGDIRSIVKEEVEHFPDLFCVDVHFRMDEKPWRVLAEVVGPQRPTLEQLAEIEKAVNQRSAVPLATTLWFREEAVLTPKGYTSYEKFTETTREKRVERIPKLFGRGDAEEHDPESAR